MPKFAQCMKTMEMFEAKCIAINMDGDGISLKLFDAKTATNSRISLLPQVICT